MCIELIGVVDGRVLERTTFDDLDYAAIGERYRQLKDNERMKLVVTCDGEPILGDQQVRRFCR